MKQKSFVSKITLSALAVGTAGSTSTPQPRALSKITLSALAVGTAVFGAAPVWAGSSSSSPSSSSDCGSVYSLATATPAQLKAWGYTDKDVAEYIAKSPSCFASTSVEQGSVQIMATSGQQSAMISSALGARFSAPPPQASSSQKQSSLPAYSGMAAGDNAAWNAWASATDNHIKQNYSITTTTVDIDNKITGLVLGVDKNLSASLIAGVSLLFDQGNSDFKKTSPGGTGSGNGSSEGYILAPYIGWQATPEINVDASLGVYGRGKYTSHSVLKSNSDRQYLAVNVKYSRWMDKLLVSGYGGYLNAQESTDDTVDASTGLPQTGTAAKNTIQQLSIGGKVAYLAGSVMPYAGLTYTSDIDRKNSRTTDLGLIGKDAFTLNLGADFLFSSSGVTAGISWQQELDRKNQKSDTLMLNASIKF